MEKKLAIKGHATRGKEVIVLLEMLGGKNVEGFIGTDFDELYTIEDNCIIQAYDWNNCVCFTLEEFLEKYPYKVGDKVVDIDDGDIGIITTMKWNEDVCDMGYRVAFDSGQWDWFTNDTIKFYQPENSKDIATTINETQPKRDIYASEFMITHMMLPKTPHNVNDELEYKIIDGYEFDRVENDKIILKVVKHKYPKTYEECWKVRFEVDGETTIEEFHHVSGYYSEPLGALQKLLCCRDAYWKIAGEEMDLGKPWKPDWTTSGQDRYTIETNYDIFHLSKTQYGYRVILVFPTAEMRNAFYENFKELLEACKELL